MKTHYYFCMICGKESTVLSDSRTHPVLHCSGSEENKHFLTTTRYCGTWPKSKNKLKEARAEFEKKIKEEELPESGDTDANGTRDTIPS